MPKQQKTADVLRFEIGHEIASRLRECANSLASGYLKPWKAESIVFQLIDIFKAIGYISTYRVEELIRGSLKMEGFRDVDCLIISSWLFLELNRYEDIVSGTKAERDARIAKGDSRS